MSRPVVTLLLFAGLLALAACTSPTTNVPVGQYGNNTLQPGEAVIVGSLSTLGLTGMADGKRLHFIFNAYDPTTNRLIPDGPTFELVRESCRARETPACDPAQPLHQVVTVPPGHYALTSTTLIGDRSATHYYVPADVSFWGKRLQPDASLQGTETIRIEVGGDEVAYFGQLSVDRPDSGREKRFYALVFTVERDDVAAGAALEAAGVNPAAMIWRPAT